MNFSMNLSRLKAERIRRPWLLTACILFTAVAPGRAITLNPGDILVANEDSNNPQFFVDGLLRIDPVSGGRTLVSGPGVGSGPAFSYPVGLAVSRTGRIFVSDAALNAILEVDPSNGNRTVISDSGRGAGPILAGLSSLTMDDSGSLYVTNAGQNEIVRVDIESGDRTLVSGNTLGSGPSLDRPISVAVSDSGALFVTNQASPTGSGDPNGSVYRVDPSTGDRTLISDRMHGTGPDFTSPWGAAIDNDGTLYVTNNWSSGDVIGVDVTTGNRRWITRSGGPVGQGYEFASPTALTLDLSGDVVLVDINFGEVIHVDVETGMRRLVSGDAGGPPYLRTPFGVAVVAIPEPSTSALALIAGAGLGLCGYLRLRRKRMRKCAQYMRAALMPEGW